MSQLVFQMDKDFFFAIASVLPFSFIVSTVLRLDLFSWNFPGYVISFAFMHVFSLVLLTILPEVKFLLLTCIYV